MEGLEVKVTGPTNPNDYDDDAFNEAAINAHSMIGGAFRSLWEAGAEADDIQGIIKDALADA